MIFSKLKSANGGEQEKGHQARKQVKAGEQNRLKQAEPSCSQ
jgi:hypothetical protein